MERFAVSGSLQETSVQRERLIALGVSNERQQEYYNQLSIDCSDPDMNQRAFRNAADGLNLTADGLIVIQQILDQSDPR